MDTQTTIWIENPQEHPRKVRDGLLTIVKLLERGVAIHDIPSGEVVKIEHEGFKDHYFCPDCGDYFDEPRRKCTHKETWGYHGGSPEEWEEFCPDCGSVDIEEIE